MRKIIYNCDVCKEEIDFIEVPGGEPDDPPDSVHFCSGCGGDTCSDCIFEDPDDGDQYCSKACADNGTARNWTCPECKRGTGKCIC